MTDKRAATLKAKCLDTVTAVPGIMAKDILKSQRNFLRELEKENKVKFNLTNLGWYPIK